MHTFGCYWRPRRFCSKTIDVDVDADSNAVHCSDVPVTVGVHPDNVVKVADWVDVLSFQTSHRLQQPEPPTPHVRSSFKPWHAVKPQ